MCEAVGEGRARTTGGHARRARILFGRRVAVARGGGAGGRA